MSEENLTKEEIDAICHYYKEKPFESLKDLPILKSAILKTYFSKQIDDNVSVEKLTHFCGMLASPRSSLSLRQIRENRHIY